MYLNLIFKQLKSRIIFMTYNQKKLNKLIENTKKLATINKINFIFYSINSK